MSTAERDAAMVLYKLCVSALDIEIGEIPFCGAAIKVLHTFKHCNICFEINEKIAHDRGLLNCSGRRIEYDEELYA